MSYRLFSNKKRALHCGPFPAEELRRSEQAADLSQVSPMRTLSFDRPDAPESLVNAMSEYQAMLDAIRVGVKNKQRAECPVDPLERAQHMKSFAFFSDAAAAGVCELNAECLLEQPLRNPGVQQLASELQTRQIQSLASGIDFIMADLKESMQAHASGAEGHSHALVLLVDFPRDPAADEPGCEWIQDAQAERAALRANETACVLANYLRLLGFEASAHSATSSDLELNRLAVAAGLATAVEGSISNPFMGTHFGIAAVSTNFEMSVDKPLLPGQQSLSSKAELKWRLGIGGTRSAGSARLFAKRQFVDGLQPFETLARVDKPTTFIDEARVPRVPKRADLFTRALFGDMGKGPQQNCINGHYARKAPASMAQRRALGAFILLQDGDGAQKVAASARDAQRNADNVKAACYFLGVDAVATSRCPPWVWYSHNAAGELIDPPHNQAISIIIDQGFETMEGASGDDWISCAQSMRAYLRFSLLGGVLAKHIRNLGYRAKAHTVVDGDVLQPPLLLLSGLGEVSRIGEVILNPFLGPRLKSGVITTDMPLTHDRPIDFGLQTFCENCNKCARECPSGAITAGPKKMFNGYEIWKSDSQKCTTYRVGTEGGAMCGRCMKTCPWNLEGLFAEAPFRAMAMHWPQSAKWLARLDDYANRGGINPIKKWWWDLELQIEGAYSPTEHPVNVRGLQKSLKLKAGEQTLAVYPAHLAPPPWPFPFPMDREAGIEAYQSMITAEEYRRRLGAGELDDLAHRYTVPDDSPVIRVQLSLAEALSDGVCKYQMRSLDGQPLPEWRAGAHIDIVVAPEFLRQYSLCGDPGDRSLYEIAVLREDAGRGASLLMHRIFEAGRRVFISTPINHFELHENASKSYLMGGGIGVTPMIAMAHRLHAIGADFELHYSASRRSEAAFSEELKSFAWAPKVHLHFSDQGGRADLDAVIGAYAGARHVYSCGPELYMNAVIEVAERRGYPEQARHLEFFSVPQQPEVENHGFKLKLRRSNVLIDVPDDQSASDVLKQQGYKVDVKCDDGICGVCRCGLLSGEVQHRDFVLSKSQRENSIILCQSRAAEAGGVVELDL